MPKVKTDYETKKGHYSEAEIEYIKDHMFDMHWIDIAMHLQRDAEYVRTKIKFLKEDRKSEEYKRFARLAQGFGVVTRV